MRHVNHLILYIFDIKYIINIYEFHPTPIAGLF